MSIHTILDPKKTVSQNNLVMLIENAFTSFKEEVATADEVFNFAKDNLSPYYKDKSDSLVALYTNGRATLLHDKVKNETLPVDTKEYYSIKQSVRQYAFTWLDGSHLKAAKKKIERFESLNFDDLNRADILSYIEQMEYHKKQIGNYFIGNDNKEASLKGTSVLRQEYILPAVQMLDNSGTVKVLKTLRSLNQEELQFVLNDGIERLDSAIKFANENLDFVKNKGPYNSCDKVATDIGELSAKLLMLKFSGLDYSKECLEKLEQKIYHQKDTCLKNVRGSLIEGASLTVEYIRSVLDSNQDLDDPTLLSFVWQMQTHRKWLEYYNDQDKLIKTYQDITTWAGAYTPDSNIAQQIDSITDLEAA